MHLPKTPAITIGSKVLFELNFATILLLWAILTIKKDTNRMVLGNIINLEKKGDNFRTKAL